MHVGVTNKHLYMHENKIVYILLQAGSNWYRHEKRILDSF